MLHRFFPVMLTLSLVAMSPGVLAQSVEQLIQQGNAADKAGNYAEAEASFRQAIANNPNNAVAYYNLGLALYNQKKLEEAIGSFRKAIQLNPNYADAYNNLGLALYYQGKLEEAIGSFRKALQLDPNYADAYNNLGIALYQQKKLEEAIASYQKAIQLDPNSAYAYNNLGIALYNQKKLEEAIGSFRKAIQLNPNYADAYNNLGLALTAQCKLEEAIASYQKAIQLNPNYALAYISLGNGLSNQKKLEEAIASYQKAIQLNPNYALAYNNLGNALSDQGKLEEAIANFRKALSLPDTPSTLGSAHTLAHNGLGLVLQQQGNLEAAIEEFQRSIDLDRNYVTAQNNLKEAQRLLALRGKPQPVVKDDQQYLPSQAEEPLVGVLRSTARIIAQIPRGSSIGAGWVVKREGDAVWILTNRHVISDDSETKHPSDKIEVEFFSELPDDRRPRYKATIEHMTDLKNPDPDLAVLKVMGIPPDIQPLKLHLGRISRNTRVRVIGHPINIDKPWNSASGEVTNYDPQGFMLPINALVAQGNSGGPVIDEQNQVIGVMVRIRTNKDIALKANEPSPDLSEVSPATGGVGLAYRIDIVIQKLREWRILN